MDYKEKYEKALEWMKSIYPTMQGSDKEDAEHYFPELALSEDEKMIIGLQGFLSAFGSDYFGTDGWQKFDDWLEKQKEQKEEDERIRKRIRLCLDECVHSDIIRDYERDEVLAYLEKQKEKPVEWSEVELEFRGEKVKVKRPFFRDDKGCGYSTTEQDDDVAWYALRAWCEKKGVSLYDLYPKEEWSEEDEKKINFLSRLIEFQVKDDEYCFGDGRLISKQEAIEMLKSLRPSKK